MKLEDIVEHYGTMVATIAHRMIQNREIAKEAAQEVWYEVFKSLPSFNADSELSTWDLYDCEADYFAVCSK